MSWLLFPFLFLSFFSWNKIATFLGVYIYIYIYIYKHTVIKISRPILKMKTIALISNFLTSVLVLKDQKYVKKKVSHGRMPHSFHWQVGQFQKWTLAIALISNFMASVLALKDEKRGSIRKKDRLIHIHFKKSFWLCGILLRIYFFIFLIMKTVSL